MVDPRRPDQPKHDAYPHDAYEFPVAPAQARLLVADRLNPGSGQYAIPLAFRVHGRFDPDAFGRAVDALVARHESLRTVFRTRADTTPVQVVAAAGRADVQVRPVVAPERVESWMRADAAAPFDPAAGPLLRIRIYPVIDRSHRILLCVHHLVSDGWSVQLMLRELAAAYRAEIDPAGTGYAPAELPIQYPDYAAWQVERQARGEYAEAVAYWADRLRDAPASTALPTDRPRAAIRSAAGGTVRMALPPGTRERLAEVARPVGGTPFLALLAGYAVFLGRLCGQDDLVIGVPVAGRDRAELQQLVGLLTNTVAVRVDLSGDPTFHDVIGRVRSWMLAGAGYQDAPFDAVVDAVGTAAPGLREPGQDPLVQVMLGYYDDTEPALPLAGAQVERTELALEDTALVDLVLYLERFGPDLVGYLNYRAELFAPATIAGWADGFQTLLAGLLADPAAPVSTPELVGAGARRRTLRAGDRTGEAAPAGPLVPDLVAARAAERPDATALVGGGHRLSYRELLARADALAARLVAAGAGPEVPVGLLLPRSPELAVAILGVLRSGAAYVPLDPADPPARLAYQITAAGVQQLVAIAATAATADRLDAPVVRMDEPERLDHADQAGHPEHPDPEVREGPPATNPARPGNLAYVLFTSGSTGNPKPVAVEHRALANLVVAVRPELGVTAGDRVLQYFSLTFDAATGDLFLAWVAGAELHLAAESERIGDDLFARLAESRITYLLLPPVAALTLPRPDELDSLRTLLVGGEAVPPELAARLAAPGRRVVNAYGPTEVTVVSTSGELRPGAPVVIGRAVPGVRTYVLDRRLRVVPTGVTGEIYLAGAHLARGYPGRPGMTAQRFVADPYGPPGSRMYRTGDLGRYDVDGQLHCLGRVDSQVKVRGFRIELGEVEAQLAAHPEVAVAAAAAHGTGLDRRLVGYVVGVAGRRPDAGSLRAHLAQRLPGFMLPEVFVHLDELPVTRTGKVDRARLPEPPAARPELAQSYLPPATATQQRVAAVWARVLGHDRIGVHDNFFELGGNSVRLLGVLAGLREAPGPEVELVDLFRYPTVAALAGHLDRLAGRAGGEPGRGSGGAPSGEPEGEPAVAAVAAEAHRRGSDRRELLAAAADRLRTREGGGG